MSALNSDKRFRTLGVLDKLRNFHLPRVPYFQIVVIRSILKTDYSLLPPFTEITVDGLEHLDTSEPFILAMNHTDRYNYLPFMYELDRLGCAPVAPWVKGKYYQNSKLASFLCWASCIPIPSRGFLLTLDWLARRGKTPNETEYRQLRLIGDGLWNEELEPEATVAEYLQSAPGVTPVGYSAAFQEHFEGLTQEVVRINMEAMDMGYRPLVFPQGTRSRPLTRGFSGIIQMALHMGVRIVPVGVSGSDRLYPRDNPFSRGGPVHYSIGAPFDPAAFDDAPRDFVPLTIRASQQHSPEFEKITDHLMQRIDQLLPPEYRFAADDTQEPAGADRFV